MSKKLPSIEQVTKWAEAARDRWLSEYSTAGEVQNHVRKYLTDRFTQLMLKTFGLESDGWSGFRVKDRTPASDWVATNATTYITEQLNFLLDTKIVLTARETKGVESAFRRAYVESVRDAAEKIAKDLGREEGKRIAGLIALDDLLAPETNSLTSGES